MLKLINGEWATANLERRQPFSPIIRELMSIHCLCEESNKLVLDPTTGNMLELTKNSALHWSRAFEWPWAFLEADPKGYHRCLDAGGGHGAFQYFVASRSFHLVNLDKNQTSIDAVVRMQKNFPYLASKVSVDKQDISKIPYKDDRFDLVFCISVLEHIENWREVFEELARVTCKGGKLIVTMDIIHEKIEGDKEFFIGVKDLSSLLEDHGCEFPQGENIMINRMVDGTLLSCVCLHFQKDVK